MATTIPHKLLTFWGIVAAILKMETGRNFSMSGINSGHHNLPTYEMSLKSDNVEFVRYCGGHFENGDQSYLVIIITLFLLFFLSLAHELDNGRSRELLDRIS
jgi:hypothetical protein